MGKSSLAQEIMNQYKIPYVSTDALTVMLKPVGQPSFYDKEKSDRFFPYLELFIQRIMQSTPDYIIEGDAFSPQHVAKISQAHNLKSVFLTMSHVDPVKIVSESKYDKWSDNLTNDELHFLCKRIEEASKELDNECEKLEMPCIDLSNNYDAQFLIALKGLMK